MENTQNDKRKLINQAKNNRKEIFMSRLHTLNIMKNIIALLLYIIVVILYNTSDEKSIWFIYFAFMAGYMKEWYDCSIFKDKH